MGEPNRLVANSHPQHHHHHHNNNHNNQNNHNNHNNHNTNNNKRRRPRDVVNPYAPSCYRPDNDTHAPPGTPNETTGRIQRNRKKPTTNTTKQTSPNPPPKSQVPPPGHMELVPRCLLLMTRRIGGTIARRWSTRWSRWILKRALGQGVVTCRPCNNVFWNLSPSIRRC